MVRLFLRHTAVVTMSVLLVGMGSRSLAASRSAAMVEEDPIASQLAHQGALERPVHTDVLRTATLGALLLEAEEVEENEVAHRNALIKGDPPPHQAGVAAAHMVLQRTLSRITVGVPPCDGRFPCGLPVLLQVLRL